MSGTKKIKLALAKKDNLFSRIQSVYDLTKKLSDKDILQRFIVQAKSVPSLRSEFIDALDNWQSLNLEEDESFVLNYAPLDAVSDMCNYIAHSLTEIENKIKSKQKGDSSGNPQTVAQAVPRLPKLEVCNFDGSPEKWPVFYQLFSKLIHENKTLTNLEKINYLVTHLQGPALTICTGVLPTAENYELLYKTLIDRYEDQRQLAALYLTKIIEFKSIPHESEKSLNAFLEQFVEAVSALKQLKIEDLSDFIFVHFALKKLDSETARNFEMTVRKDKMPKFESLTMFVREQAKILGRTRKPPVIPGVQKSQTFKNFHTFISTKPQNKNLTSQKCPLCSQPTHQLYRCPMFHKMSVDDRWDASKKCNACFNCLSLKQHSYAKCASENSCTKCHRKHHSLLHREIETPLSKNKNLKSDNEFTVLATPTTKNITGSIVANKTTSQSNESSCFSEIEIAPMVNVLLATAIIEIQDEFANFHQVRALIDNGSQSHFITPACCDMLGLPKSSTATVVKGIGSGGLKSKYSTSLTFRSTKNHSVKYTISALVGEFLNDPIPTHHISKDHFAHIKGLELADPEFGTPGKIDILLGAALWPYLSGSGKKFGPPNMPTAVESSLGYLIMGEISSNHCTNLIGSNCLILQPSLKDLVQKFWSLEEIPECKIMSEDEKKCEQLFLETYSRNEQGRYSVALPFKLSPTLLGNTKEFAKDQFMSIEKRLVKHPDLYNHYKLVLENYISKGYVSGPIHGNDSDAYYMPHHGIYKPEKLSTPLRIVFNASTVSTSRYSLNDLLHTGPKLYAEIFDILLNFRLFKIVLSADVSKMYLQINVDKDYRKYQRFFWRPNKDREMQIYEFNTLVFGIKSSPYLALKVLKMLADSEKIRFPLASEIVNRDVYMDDVVCSVPDYKTALTSYDQLNRLFASGGFKLTKWCSNSDVVLNEIPEEEKQNSALEFNKDSSAKVLGMQWLPQEDLLFFKIQVENIPCTKRNMLSIVARIFDPLGLLAPVSIVAKLLIKDLWMKLVDWDETPPQNIIDKWNRICKELPLLSNLKVSRHCAICPGLRTTLVGFSDASEKAYGAVVYVKTDLIDGNCDVRLLCAKSKVAPKKVVSVPRLELCAALLLSELIKHIVKVFSSRHCFNSIAAFTDSTVTLHWIKSDPSTWKSFVANRVAKIQENVTVDAWRHVPGQENISDCLSRGLSPAELLNYPCWFNGPYWLRKREEEWPSSAATEKSPLDVISKETKQKTIASVAMHQEEFVLQPMLARVSTYQVLLRATAIVFRFLRLKSIVKHPISAKDLEEAELAWIKAIQRNKFRECIHQLSNNLPVPKTLLYLDPFMKENLLRVGGRLEYSDLPYNQRHPLLLPKNEQFVDLLIDHYHRHNMHTGSHLVLALLRLKYWILSARGQVRRRIRQCNICFKVNPKPITPKMAPLPEARVHEAKAFTHTGVDYAGPFMITMSRLRKLKPQKAYLCLFVCLTVKAIHIELVADLSTECFLNALKRFLSRRGPCSKLYSDCGTNFIGARNQLEEMHKFSISEEFRTAIGKELASRKVEWSFNPPSAPHFGGLWESNVKSVKSHLKRVIGLQILTYEELNTVLIQIEALLNSRPLSVLCNDPNAPSALTPAHFLTLSPTLDYLPSINTLQTPLNRLSRYRLLDRIVQDYWKRWHLEYLQDLQVRSRWREQSKQLETGTIVILMDTNITPLSWQMGIVEETFPGKDGTIRVANVRTKRGVYRRPVIKLCPLPMQ